MLENHNNSSMLSDSMMGISTKSRHHKKSIYKNIKQTQLNLKQIKRFEQRNIFPFSLKQQQHRLNTNGDLQQEDFVHDNMNTQQHLKQSDMSQKLLKRFQSRNHVGFKNDDIKVNDKNSYDFSSRHENNILTKNQQNTMKQSDNKNQTNLTNENLIMLQIHLTIAKKKYTIKVSNQITSQQLQQVIQNFLIQNSISNPTKKSHLKTKRSIIEMVDNKIKDGNSTQYKQLGKCEESQKIGTKIFNQNQNQENRPINNKENNMQKSFIQKSPTKKLTTNSRSIQKPSKFQKPIIQQKHKNPHLITQNDSINYQQNYQEEQQACSPSFKSSAYVDKKSPLKKTSQFSSQPKHQANKYEKIISNHYNEAKQKANSRVEDIEAHAKENNKKNYLNHNHYYSHGQNQTVSQSLKATNIPLKNQQSPNFSQYQTEQQKAKSVYEKWKQRQKSKQINGKPNERQNFTNALKQRKQQTDNSFVTQMSQEKKLQKKEKYWNNAKGNRGFQKSNLSINTHDIKDNQIRQPSRSPMYNKKINKENFNMNKSTNSVNKSPYHQRNKTTIDEDYSPNKNMNRTQIVGSRKESDNEVFETNKYIRGVKEATQRAMTPNKTRMSINQPKTPSNNPNHSKVYTIYDEDEYPIHEMSPDHFYKQGLVFEAKKKQQIQNKFKSLYPFTTRNVKDFKETENGGSRNATMRNAKENSGVSDRSKDKYFSSKLSMNKNNITTKSSANIILDQKEKSALHERLYQQNKTKQAKMTATEASQRLIKIAKAPQSQNQIKVMQENLSHIKGLSREKKVKLIQRNIKIKQKIKEKDRIIDEQLQKMINQGKVKPTCQLVQVRKSPFRKTKIF